MLRRVFYTLSDEPPSQGEHKEKNETAAPAGESTSSSRSEFKDKLVANLFSLSQWLQVKLAPTFRKLDWNLVRNIFLILCLSFVLASSVSTFAANFALTSVAKGGAQSAKSEASLLSGVNMSSPKSDVSPSEIKRTVLARNIFNSTGEMPNEDGEKKVTRTQGLDFDTVSCTEETLPVEIVGTIYTGNPMRSFVSVKDPKVEDVDIYKSGDLIIEHEDYEVYKVYRGRVELRKGDQKICVGLKGVEDVEGPTDKKPGTPAVASPENVEVMEFDSAFISNEIGPGYANILNAAKMIPEVEDGKMAGFKLLSIVPGSLFDKMKLQNGDVVADVNGVSMRDPSQGFKLYQALQEEREITIGIIRGGQPMTRKVRVK